MRARVGDHVIIDGGPVGEHRRVGVVTTLVHADGRPPYYVRWFEDGHVSVVFAGPGGPDRGRNLGGAWRGSTPRVDASTSR
ncbi:DUF1918 domain-containing protein [Actinoplanes sp. NPDC023714]|uniref:DUF1918 domain-containing protein n=1 Tax=Actinoplanes sp. NPDC023714 TaxID=3154322 RepID=UPI0034014D0F